MMRRARVQRRESQKTVSQEQFTTQRSPLATLARNVYGVLRTPKYLLGVGLFLIIMVVRCEEHATNNALHCQ